MISKFGLMGSKLRYAHLLCPILKVEDTGLSGQQFNFLDLGDKRQNLIEKKIIRPL